MSAFCSDTSTMRLGPVPLLYLLAGWGTSSPCMRDSRPRAADTRGAGFHTSVAVATQQSGSNPVDYTVWGVLQERVDRKKIQTGAELQQHITEESVVSL